MEASLSLARKESPAEIFETRCVDAWAMISFMSSLVAAIAGGAHGCLLSMSPGDLPVEIPWLLYDDGLVEVAMALSAFDDEAVRPSPVSSSIVICGGGNRDLEILAF